MARGINKVILVGNLGNDPDMRATQSGAQIANLSIATSESWRDKQTGEMQERTEWHRVVFFNRLAEIAGQYLKKGSKVYIEGKLQTRSWDDQATGQKKYSTEIIGNEMQMLDSRGDNMGGGYAPAQAPAQPMGQPMGQPAQAPARPPQPAVAPPPEFGGSNLGDDDIPF